MTRREKIFVGLYGTYEVLLNVGSGSFMLLAPVAFLQQYAPLASTAEVSTDLAQMLVRSFGMMVVTLGLAQLPAIRLGSQTVRRWLIVALLLGDIVHFAVSWPYFAAYGVWNFGSIFNFGNTIGLALSRTYFLLAGIPQKRR